ncbi:hypothetical protein JTB14_023893 [Gonioctena quinquepunctata]|nr:hypothetical protein JTB14_023893 [Gonioctena quinquepunctata]
MNADENYREIICNRTGSYDINDIASFLSKYIDEPRDIKKKSVEEDDIEFSLEANLNTLQCEIYSRTHAIDFRPEDCIGRLLGFSPRFLKPEIIHKSDLPVKIVKV